MNEIKIVAEKSPHLRRKDSLSRMLLDVIIALAPVVICSVVFYSYQAAINIGLSCLMMCLCEFIYTLIRYHIPYDGNKHSFKEHYNEAMKHYSVNNILAPCVSGIIFALILPSTCEPVYFIYLTIIFGSIFGIVIGKLVFGGNGNNIFNPAAVGMVFAKICFGSHFKYLVPDSFNVTTGGTILTGLNGFVVPSGHNSLTGKFLYINQVSVLDMFLGKYSGVMGETFKIAILIGLIYLLIRRAIDFRIVVSYFGMFTLLMALAGIIICSRENIDFFRFMGFQILSGGFLFGLTYMATDPVTCPINPPGRIIYGLVLGVITVIIRLFGALPEGVSYSILIGNMISPFIDYPSWSGSRYSKGKLICMGCIVAISLLVVGLGIGFGGNLV